MITYLTSYPHNINYIQHQSCFAKSIEVLNPTKDSTITLVTCTPIRIATHRLIIKAKEKSSL
ncbi:sortase [Clostridium tyrobutyricum]|nr:sortase [Clostridium tyrobutyricum]MBV4431235.1 sortase [Clostridium tyrobutyricum]MBV4435074.1 sortase [Clostridium tyrobutyricum]MBV4440845.1 sortase [Clostridium tyrobutyricum]MBV4449200.1 sortase [Clostridium tyrobutyricum]QNB68146.1 sortase [Clostridium tyrobutyricum]